jgi:hypothetical protein
MLGFLKSTSGTRVLPPVMMNSGDDDKDDPPTGPHFLSYFIFFINLT